MRACLALASVLTGCVYFDSDGPDEPPVDIDDEPPVDLPDPPPGTWEPFPDAWIRDARVTLDEGILWWVATRQTYPTEDIVYDSSIWMTATSTNGRTARAPAPLDGGGGYDPGVVVTGESILVKTSQQDTYLHRFDKLGNPLAPAVTVVAAHVGEPLPTFQMAELVATSTGRAQLVGGLAYHSHDVAIIDLDATGTPERTRLLGMADLGETASATTRIRAAARSDGSTVLAWERYYNGCVSALPPEVFAASITADSLGAPLPVRDEAAGEHSAAVAAHGLAAFVAWFASTPDGERIALARFPDVTTPIAELGDSPLFASSPTLTLAAPDRGALAWYSSTGVLSVTPFADDPAGFLVGDPLEITLVDPDTEPHVVALVHVADNRYLLAWLEYPGFSIERQPSRLFARMIDLAPNTMRPAPPLSPPVAAPTRPRPLRCP